MQKRYNLLVLFGILAAVALVMLFWRNSLTKFQLLVILASLYVIGGIVGEVLMYAIGFGIEHIERVERSKFYRMIRKWRKSAGLIAFGVALINSLSPVPPVPFVSGVYAGSVEYPLFKFLTFTFLGRSMGTLIILFFLRDFALDFLCRNFIIEIFGSLCI